MASIRPIKNKEGEITSYQITVSAGRVGGKLRWMSTWFCLPGIRRAGRGQAGAQVQDLDARPRHDGPPD